MTPTQSGLGTLAARAHELLDSTGRPLTEEHLVRYVFGLTGVRESGFWRGQLVRLLAAHDLFSQLPDGRWALASWNHAADVLRGLRYVVVDVETTGLNPRTQSLIEIAAVRCQGCRVLDTFNTLVDPGRPIPTFIRRFTGIHDEMVAGAPGPADAVAGFLHFAGTDLLVGHNVRFDLNFLGEAARRHLDVAIGNDSLDTIRLGSTLVPGLRRPSLDRLAVALGLATPTRHRALADADLAARAFWRLIERAEARGIATLGRLQAEVGPPNGSAQQRGTNVRTGKTLLDPALRQNLPGAAGVYLMKDERGEIIYVGKAKNLRARVSSYYAQPLGYRRKMDGLLESVRALDTIVTGTELQALILEDRLIKRHQPRFNVQQRNYQHYPFIKIDVQNPFPRVVGTRDIEADGARYFGPYRSGRSVKTMVELVQRLFPVRTCTRVISEDGLRARSRRPRHPCLRHALGRCLAPCHGRVSVERYGEVVQQVCDFLSGTGEDMLARVESELRRASHNLQFERAALLRDTLRDARQILITQQLLSGAVEHHNLLIVYPSSEEGHAEVFGIRHGRLQEQSCLDARRSAQDISCDLHRLCERLLASREPPAVIGQDEVDGINIIARWIYRHSDERSFIPLHDLRDATVERALGAVRSCLMCSQ